MAMRWAAQPTPAHESRTVHDTRHTRPRGAAAYARAPRMARVGARRLGRPARTACSAVNGNAAKGASSNVRTPLPRPALSPLPLAHPQSGGHAACG
jgi:hypothetical protein